MRLARTTFAYEETVEHLRQAGRNPLIESYLVQFLLVALYAEMEEKLREIVSRRLETIEDRKVVAFILKTSESMIRRVKKAEINDLLKAFDCGDGDVLAAEVGELNLQPYFDAITNRHKVSHDDGASMTLDYFGQALPCAEAILTATESLLARELP